LKDNAKSWIWTSEEMASQCGPRATGEEKKRRKQNWNQKGWISKLKTEFQNLRSNGKIKMN